MANKMTKKDWFEVIKAVVETSEMENREGAIKFIDHELELLANKKSNSAKTKVQKANEGVKADILAAMGDIAEPVTISALMKDERLCDYSNQKLSALMRQLEAVGEVVRTKDKKSTLFSLAETAED